MKQVRGNETISTVISIVALYALFSALWMYLSDTVLETCIQNPQQIARLARYRGFAFILVTSTFLSFLITRYVRRTTDVT